MILGHHGVSSPNQKTLIRTLHTDLIGERGTTHGAMRAYVRNRGFIAYTKSNRTLADIEKALLSNNPVIVHYTEPSEDDDHYAVVIGLMKDTVLLNDPWNGKNYKLSRSEFLKRWRDTTGKFYRWALFARLL